MPRKRRPAWQIGGWGPSPLGIDDMTPRMPRNTGRTRRLLVEKKLADAGIPRRRGRGSERRYLRRVEKERRAEADRPRRPGPHGRPRRRPGRRPWQVQRFKPHREIVLAVCALTTCQRVHSQRRPHWQTTGFPGPTGAFTLRPEYRTYCCTEHRVEAWRLTHRIYDEGTVCAGPDCSEWVPRTPRPGRPSDYHAPRCKQRAYRARRAALAALAAAGVYVPRKKSADAQI